MKLKIKVLVFNIKPPQNLNNGNGIISNLRKDVGYCDIAGDHWQIKSALLTKSVEEALSNMSKIL